MEMQGTQMTKTVFEKKNKIEDTYQFQNTLQSYSNQDYVVLAWEERRDIRISGAESSIQK